MKNLFLSVGLMLMSVFPGTTKVHGHGSPIHIGVDAGKLTTSGGLELISGFADMAFDPSEDAGLDFPGSTVRTDLPGFEIANLSSGSTLQLEILGRNDLTDSTIRKRWLWYWSSTTEEVVEAENDPDFMFRRKDLGGSLTIHQFTTPIESILTVSESITPNSHQHYLRYELDNSPAAAFGVYGAFARVLSPGFEPSEPFLFAFAYGVLSDDYAKGALAINQAAGPRGDYDIDGDVDGSDFLAWQRSIGATGSPAADGSLNGMVDATDLQVWQQHFGESENSSTLLSVQSIPEPAAMYLLLGMLTLLSSQERERLEAYRRPLQEPPQ